MNISKEKRVKLMVVLVYFLAIPVVYYLSVISIRDYSKTLEEVLAEHTELVIAEPDKEPEFTCAEGFIKDLFSENPKISLPPGYRSYWLSGDIASIKTENGKRVRIPTKFFLIGNTNLDIDSYVMSNDSEPSHAQITGCAYKGKVPMEELLQGFKATEGEIRFYVALDGEDIKRLK